MARLRYDGDAGCYIGRRIRIPETAMLRRIRRLTDANLEHGANAVEAAEAAWQAALDEAAWRPEEDGVELLERPA